ncbi:TetR/AcrR family transcriptional regulator, partial [Gordonibacter pamelaeae]
MDSGSRASAARRAIVEAYIDLMEEKPYDSIRVKELVQRSNVARSTFYVHFRDAIDVLEGIEGTLLGLLSLYRSDGDAYKGAIAGMPFECMENWFEVCIEHERVLRALTGPHGDPYFTVRLQNQIRQELNQMMDDDRAPRDRLRPYYVELLTASYIGLMSYIVKEKNKSEYLEAHELASIANSTS